MLCLEVWRERRVEGRRVEENGYPSSCLDILKIMMERKGNDLNRQIYPYLKMDLQHWSIFNLLDYIIITIACNIFFDKFFFF